MARTSRCCIAAGSTRKARAISGQLRPPTRRRVSATRASSASAGWQHMRISRRRSSRTGASTQRAGPGRPRPALRRRARCRHLAQRRVRSHSHALTPQQVERAPAGRGHEPPAGVRRHAVARPPAGREDERVLRRLLGQGHVPEAAGQRREHRRPIRAEGATTASAAGSVMRRASAAPRPGRHPPVALPRRPRRRWACGAPRLVRGRDPAPRSGSSRAAAPSTPRTGRR